MKKHTLILGALGLSLMGFSMGAWASITFTDVPANHWAVGGIEYVTNAGLMKGDEGKTTFRPNDGVTRGELAMVEQRQGKELENKLANLQSQIDKLEGKASPSPSSLLDFLTYKNDEFKLNYPKNFTYTEDSKGLNVSFENEKKELDFGIISESLDALRAGDKNLSDKAVIEKNMAYYLGTAPVVTQKIADFNANKFILEAGCDGPSCQPKTFIAFRFYNSANDKIYTLSFFETNKTDLIEKVINSLTFDVPQTFFPAYMDKYGFQLTFPSAWKEVNGYQRTLDWGSLGKSDSTDFSLPEQEGLLNISVHSKDQWNQLQKIQGPKPTYLGEKDQHVFGYSVAQQGVNNEMQKRLNEVSGILKTFK